MRALLRATIVVLTVAVLAGPFAAATGSAASACAGVRTQGAWTTISAPNFPSGAVAMSAYAVDPRRPSVIFATNGSHVMRTMDGGCKWSDVFTLELIPTLDRQVSSANTSIKHIVIPETKSSVYLTLEEKVGPITRPHIAVSHDSGETWTMNNAGLPPASGGVSSFVVAPSNAKIIYLMLQSVGGGNALYASSDGGDTWEERSQAADGASDLAVDPLAPNALWLWGAGLVESKDGGRTRTVRTETHNVSMADVFHAPGMPARVMAYEPETQTMVIITDGSSAWTRIFGPRTFSHSMTNTGGYFDVVVAGSTGVFQMVEPEFWVDIHPKDQGIVYDLQSTRVGEPLVFGHIREDNQLVRYKAEKVDIDPFTTVSDGVVKDTTSLSPRRKTVKLKPGESRTVRYNLGLPPHPTPLDVFFLVDTSNSMDTTINGLREGMQQVIDELEGSRIDVQFGVGEFKDYPIPGYGNPESGDFPYRLNRAIGPAGPQLAAALEELEASGGGRDPQESQLTGLYQAATGSGEPGFVAAGQEAGFRPAALKVIVHITDAAFHTDPAHPSPPWQDVVDALTEKGILQIGLSVYGQNGPQSLAHLTDMAEETDTIAPAGGVDCEGDGTNDVGAGQPLACVVATESEGALGLAPAIISTLKAVTQEVRVEFRAEDSPLVRAIEPSVYPAYDVNDPGTLTFDVEFECPTVLSGQRDNVSLAAQVAARTVAGAETLVVCKEPKPFEPEPEQVLQLLIPTTVIPQRPPPPPPAPPAVAESAPGTQQMFQAQPAAAAQEQEEVQTVLAWQSTLREKLAEEYSFSSVKRDAATPPWTLYGAAVLMAMAYAGVSIRSRVASRVVPSRSSSR